MTDAEARELETATARAMGWCVVGRSLLSGRAFGVPPEGGDERTAPECLTDPAAAWAALEWLQRWAGRHEDGRLVVGEYGQRPHVAAFDGGSFPLARGEGETLAEAVCRAVVAAAGGE